jgi:hypothetical protein
MKKIVLTFGLISGAIISALMLATVPFMHQIGMTRGMVIGYTTMVLSFLLVFFGIRSYRENVGDGRISFGRALSVGLLIMLITCFLRDHVGVRLLQLHARFRGEVRSIRARRRARPRCYGRRTHQTNGGHEEISGDVFEHLL